jgi:hypothetical protein
VRLLACFGCEPCLRGGYLKLRTDVQRQPKFGAGFEGERVEAL